MKRVLIAAGGTGGHVFPGLAVAEALRELADVDVTFVGTPRGFERELVPARGWPLEMLDVAPIKGGGAARALRGALVAARETVRAFSLVRRLAPSVVLSVGGYAAGPVSLAAALLRIPVTVHEPNSVPGFTNRVLGPLAKRAYVAFDETAPRFKRNTARTFGVPLRSGFAPRPYAADRGRARLLIMGGSQGAAALNERLPRACARIAEKVPHLEVVHQAGRDRDADVRRAYEAAGVTRVTVTPFLEDVAGEIARADVVVARAGANTVAEISSVGRASLLVPFPFAADDHQAKNAEALARAGGCVALRQQIADEARLARELERLFVDHDARARMADAARAHGKPHAAHDVARDLLDLAGIAVRSRPKTNGVHDSSVNAPSRTSGAR